MQRWLQFFRFPNLPTAPGDALAGAAFLMPAGDELLPRAFAAGVSALFLYMYGLADNDFVDAERDRQLAPERPIPRGEISPFGAIVAAVLCLLAAIFVGEFFNQPFRWACAVGALVGCIFAYNRTKSRWLMGLCRGLSLAAGALAVWVPGRDAISVRLGVSLLLLVLGWTLYIAAVTKLSEGEDRASDGLGRGRFLLGLVAFVPLAAFAPLLDAPEVEFVSSFPAFLPGMGCLFAFFSWCAAVAPLGRPHGPEVRRRAVGRAIGAIMFLQVGFMLVAPRVSMLVAAAVLWFGARLARRLAPSVSGS